MIEIEICMGSSCYSRGNSRALELIEDYIKEKNLDVLINLKGQLCHGICSEGPNIIVNGNIHRNCDPDCVVDLINHYLEENRNEVTEIPDLH